MKAFRPIHRLLLALFVLGLIAAPVQASDVEKEKRWREQISDSLLDGEIVTLNDGEGEFIAIETKPPENGSRLIAVILLHGIGVHPDWPQVIHPLRVGLAERGWTTLSLQMPILGNEAKASDYLPLMSQASKRIQAGMLHLLKKRYRYFIVVGHSLGAYMGVASLGYELPGVQGFVGIGLNHNAVKHLDDLGMPALDLYGEQDQPEVVGSAPQRKHAGSVNKQYRQQMVTGADHFFTGREDELLEIISQWIKER